MTSAPPRPTPDDFRAAAAQVATWRRPVLLTHERPDGDALGCLLAMRSILAAQGIDATAIVYEPIPQRYQSLPGVDKLNVLQQSRARKEAEDPNRAGDEAEHPSRARKESDDVLARADGVLVLDTCSFSQLHPVADFLRSTSAPIIALDHHRTRDLPAARYLIDDASAAAALLVYDWASAASWPLPSDAQTLLFLGIATDTGWFRHSNTSPAALRASADLIERGVDLDRWYQALYLSDPPRVLRARSAALATLELHHHDTVAVMVVSQETLNSLNAQPSDLEEAVNLPMSAATVEVSLMLTELPDGTSKASLRSKGQVDVSAIAAQFQGGGHQRAAGARLPHSLTEARKILLSALE